MNPSVFAARFFYSPLSLKRGRTTVHWLSLSVMLFWIVSSAQLHAQDFFKELQDKLGVSDETTPAAEEALPAPIAPSKGEPAENSPSVGVPAISPIPIPSLEGDSGISITEPAVSDRPYLGITVEPLLGGGVGLKIVDVTKDSPAWKAGLNAGDLVLAMDSTALSSIDQFATQVMKHAPKEVVKFLVDRRGRSLTLPVVLGSTVLAEQSGIKNQNGLPAYTPIGPGLADENTTQSLRPNDARKPSLGVSIERLSEATRQRYGVPVHRGAVVVEIAPNSPAARAGFLLGDTIVEADSVVIQSDSDLLNWAGSTTPGQIVNLRYYRGRTLRTASIRLEAGISPADPNITRTPLAPSATETRGNNPLDRSSDAKVQELESKYEALQRALEETGRELEALRQNR